MAAQAGPRNLITDVPGILVGQAEDRGGISGTTVVLAEAPAVASVDVRGGAPGSRETELLAPGTLVDRIDAIVLSGGSAFGLDAAAGVMEWLVEAGRGFPLSARRAIGCRSCRPRSCSISAFPAGEPWTGEPPYRALGRAAVAAAAKDFALGNAGAGLGATAGRLKGGIGSASLCLAAAPWSARSSLSTAGVPLCGRIAGAFGPPIWHSPARSSGSRRSRMPRSIRKTSRGCGAAVAGGEHNDRGRRHRRSARQGRMPASGDHGAGRPRPCHPAGAHAVRRRHRVRAVDRRRAVGRARRLAKLGSAAADCLARAVMRAVLAAEPLGGVPSWRQLWGSEA